MSAASGLLAGWLLGRFVILPLKRNRSYAAGIREIKGQEGVVTLELRDDFVGTIRVHRRVREPRFLRRAPGGGDRADPRGAGP